MRRPFASSIVFLRICSAAFAITAGISALTIASHHASAASAGGDGKVPVLVELFTSEGCSSCPPADDLLAKLDTQPLPGVRAIVLSEHVTYWNQLGWRDPFSFEAMTERQQEYGSRFNLRDVYTPQAVVDGAAQCTGSDGAKLAKAITEAARTPKSDLAIAGAHWSGDGVQFTVHGSANADANVFAALAEDSAQANVLRGENGGRTLHHVAVVRSLQEMGKASGDAKSPLSGRVLTVRPNKEAANERGALRLVVFVADRHNGHVLAVAEQIVPRS
jgi:hypothetical protein